MGQAFSNLNFLNVEKDELTLTLCNIWPFSYESVKVLLILDSGTNKLHSCDNYKYL